MQICGIIVRIEGGISFVEFEGYGKKFNWCRCA